MEFGEGEGAVPTSGKYNKGCEGEVGDSVVTVQIWWWFRTEDENKIVW